MATYANVNVASGDFDTDVAGTDKPGNAVLVHDGTKQIVYGLSAHVVVDAETDTLTITGRWQISPDNTTWSDLVQPNNPADVALATGTAGADATVTKDVSAPVGVYGARFARYVVQNGVATGNAVDTFAIGYNYADAAFASFV